MPEAQHWDGQQTLPLDLIVVGGENPRQRFDEDALEELAASIERDGLLQPILVRPVPSSEEGELLKRARASDAIPEGSDSWAEHDGHLYELVSGERRLRAHRRLGREQIRAEVRPMDRETAVRIRLVENVQREDLDELEEAAAYRRMVDELGYDVEAIADEVGKSTSYVYQRMKLLELAEPVQEALHEGHITAGHAIEIARLQTPALQQRALDACHVRGFAGSEDGTMSVRDLRDWIRRNTHLDLHAAPWKKDDAKLLPQAGSCTECPKRTGQSADLWPEVEDGAVCTDPDCYERKVVAYVDREAERLEAAGDDFVRVSSELFTVTRGSSLELGKERGRIGPAVTPDALGKHGYTRLDEEADPCEHVVTGLVVDGGEPGETITVCTADDCDVHGEEDGEGESEEEARRREVMDRNRRERGRRKSRTNRRLAEALLLEEEMALETRLELAVVRLWDELWDDNQRAAADELGLESHAGTHVAEWADGRTVDELVRALLTMTLAIHFGGSRSSRPPQAYRVRGEIVQGLLSTSVEDVAEEVREEDDWILPEDLPGFTWLVPAEDLDTPLGSQTYHAGRGEEVPFCGNAPEPAERVEAEPGGWKWTFCERCEAHLVQVQTSAMEGEGDG